MPNKKTEMQSGKTAAAISTQSHLNIAEIKQGTLVLKDGSLRAVLVVSSTNFSLKSAQEQNALVAAYQSFLNSLDFPIQILMQSRKLDINAYLDKLRAIMQQQTNELLRMQTQEYIEYITKLVEFASIMNKTFYVVVPYGVSAIKDSFFGKISSMLNPASTISLKHKDFEEHREALYQRLDHIASALNGMGLRTITLDTEELIELMYNSYNLSAASPIRIKSVEDLDLAHPDE
jgi:type IV secretory pathway VirB4 component